jgi:hypothetical protein
MQLLQPAVFLLCMATSLLCAVLLVRSYRTSRTRLLLWSALCFIGLSVNNFFLFLDVVVLPDVNLLPMRQLSALLAVGVLLFGFIWESE